MYYGRSNLSISTVSPAFESSFNTELQWFCPIQKIAFQSIIYIFVYNKFKKKLSSILYFDSKKNHIYFFRFLKICRWEKNGSHFEKKLFVLEDRRAMLASSPRLVALGASERARDSRRALALKMCMFIQKYSLYRVIVSADLFSHSVSIRHTEQIKIMNRTAELPILFFRFFLSNIVKLNWDIDISI